MTTEERQAAEREIREITRDLDGPQAIRDPWLRRALAMRRRDLRDFLLSAAVADASGESRD